MSNLTLYIDTENRRALSRVANDQNGSQPQTLSSIQDVHQGDTLTLDLYFVSPTGNSSWPYQLDRYASAAITARIGLLAGPDTGTFRISFNNCTSRELGLNETPA